ncbi:MAG: T9SS type A sorting domain-containing protein [Saprospiraceae bacterium]
MRQHHTVTITSEQHGNRAAARSREIQVSPNPANSYLHVRMPQRHKVQELVMADVTGRMVYRFPTAPGALNEVMDITGVPPGMYFLLGGRRKGQR